MGGGSSVSYELSPEEKDILEAFENGELTPVSDVQQQLEMARQAAHNTLKMIEGQQTVFGGRSSSMSGPVRSSRPAKP